MRRIAITQRLVESKTYQEIRETLDLKYNRLIFECGFIPIILPYEVDFENYFSLFKIDGVLLTGGNDLSICRSNKLSLVRDDYEKQLLKFCIKNEIPVLGICRGMQIIADFFNSSFKTIENQVNTRHQLIINPISRFNVDLNKIDEVNSYHDFSIDKLSSDFIISATNEAGVIKAIEHKEKSIFGQMWHPERENPFSKPQLLLIQEFFNENVSKIISIAKSASEKIIEIYNNDFRVNYKEDESPVTKADIRANKIIVDKLSKISNYPVLTEENPVEYKVRKNWNKFWLVDPLDGTKDFISKNGQFTVNISLIVNKEPILGVICVPITGDIYFAIRNGGTFKNGVKIFNNSKRKQLIGCDSNFHSSKKTNFFFKKQNVNKIEKYGSSLKFCKLAEGTIDIYPRFSGTKEWDTAASQIIIQEAGCKIIDLETKKELTYNKESMCNNHFIACRKDIYLGL